jgi:hypothetical protein
MFNSLSLNEVFFDQAGKDRFLPARSEDAVYVFNRDLKENVVSVNIVPFLFGGPTSGRPNKKVVLASVTPVAIITLDSSILKKYKGTYYRPESDEYFFVYTQGTRLLGSVLNSPAKFELLPVSDHKFVRKGVEGYTVSFKNDSEGLPVLTIQDLVIVSLKKSTIRLVPFRSECYRVF